MPAIVGAEAFHRRCCSSERALKVCGIPAYDTSVLGMSIPASELREEVWIF